MRGPRSVLLALPAVLALGLGWFGSRACEAGESRGRAASGSAPRVTPDEVDSLRRSLEGQASALLALADELALLRDEVAALRAGQALAPGAEAGSGAASVPGDAPSGTRAAEDAPSAPGERPLFDTEGLLRAGVSPREVDGLRERWERLELERLELKDRALREGWLSTQRHQDEYRALEAGFRDELGEDAYDAYLFATGQPNRVLVKEVLGNSPASRAGVQPGDLILRYDGERTFAPRDLQLATAQGERGELVRIEIVREGRPLTLRVQRGPLGIVLRGVPTPPQSPS